MTEEREVPSRNLSLSLSLSVIEDWTVCQAWKTLRRVLEDRHAIQRSQLAVSPAGYGVKVASLLTGELATMGSMGRSIK